MLLEKQRYLYKIQNWYVRIDFKKHMSIDKDTQFYIPMYCRIYGLIYLVHVEYIISCLCFFCVDKASPC